MWSEWHVRWSRGTGRWRESLRVDGGGSAVTSRWWERGWSCSGWQKNQARWGAPGSRHLFSQSRRDVLGVRGAFCLPDSRCLAGPLNFLFLVVLADCNWSHRERTNTNEAVSPVLSLYSCQTTLNGLFLLHRKQANVKVVISHHIWSFSLQLREVRHA